MKNIVNFLLFFFSVATISAQTDFFASWEKETIDKANTAADENYLTTQEKEVILLLNLARLDGEKFTDLILKPYIEENNLSKKNHYIKSLIKDLKDVHNLSVLQPDKKLHLAAKHHAKDMGKTGQIGHNSSDGTGCFERMRNYADGNRMAENCSYGFQEPIEIVMQLLIDENVPSLGHRKNILDKKLAAIGVSIQPHKVYDYNCVMDFSDTQSEN